jgi:hypothetical protein
MRSRCGKIPSAHRLPALSVLIVGAALSLVAQSSTTASAVAAAHLTAQPRPAVARPGAVGELDCNGLSPIQRPVKPDMPCADIRGGWGGRFYENGHHIGHDEPSIRFLSSRPGSGSNFSTTEKLPTDPSGMPTVRKPGHDVTHWFELSVAPWISTDVCDPDSAPLTPCTPRSDANAPHGSYPGGGAAFVELQFYPPGFARLSRARAVTTPTGARR